MVIHSRFLLESKAIADGEHRLVVTQIAAIRGEVALQVVMRSQHCFKCTRNEPSPRVRGQSGNEILLSHQELQAEPIAELARLSIPFINATTHRYLRLKPNRFGI